ncbi:MAG: 30S ribosomal protein S3 [Chloroflexi bacterium]|nr:MAG: 30S ribosomal protein S3 [Anaerolineaceae bacterium 4572_32.1]RLD00366.1 MAG: 30S ribosomal protein S3 [Chloroflexota bacterium]
MGRKVHPYGFRLGVIRDWKARWYAEGEDYANLLHEDLKIRRLIVESVGHAGISNVEIERFPNQVSVVIWTARPGIVIGRKGSSVKALRKTLEEITGKRVSVDVQEVEQPELDAKLVAENVVNQLERRISHGRAMKRAIQAAMRAGAQGIKVMCKGRLYGAEMSRQAWQREGRVPLHTLRADIDYAQEEAHTTYGRLGVKVWIYKGEVLPAAKGQEEPFVV